MGDDDHPPSGKTPGAILGEINRKLLDTKQKWAREGRALTGEDPPTPSEGRRDRLPPGQRLTRDWPVLDLGVRPDITPDRWAFGVSGLIENPISWDWRDFLAQPQVERTTDIHCVTTWSRYDNTWKGVGARHFLDIVRPRSEAAFLIFHSHDGYTTNVPLKAFDDDDVVLARQWNGADITREHGGPMRPVIPKLYFWKSAKWVRHITFVDKDAPGFWETRGYHNSADPWKEERYG
ncbi:sulfite oxidase-like oxidoreductase [Varunaivibrio sulfuroxidans]|uniref:DMSO/TMAO reductase YedYZ molybdopterin-dependent catalytic subunit n=1 Tax=Varunaivibrio sulfuroxidans TaxID=1773489 RepID=A0A4R3JG84_9PROT|nr:sulfite oxidase-like oxidoreductase [Varunaivibrio sulfuroxidans]TCS64216.1 DMSO/TMAO reductase YedYZ molybdopterin-dependent catalytic subunit [Varunaivibrio sulfuroxidans]WES31341.1 sulfite oxidase-like oxidoreductase [Varunaivibrio sulfuroxidans]